MESFKIIGGRPLFGRLTVHGAKNSALPILAATLLARGESVIRNCPDLADTRKALEILTALGCRVRRQGDAVLVDTTDAVGTRVPDQLMGAMRASVLFLGSLLGRHGEALACWPGGCALGARPIDLHIRAFQALGAVIADQKEHLHCQSTALKGCHLYLPFPSVGATENAMLAACGADGVTVIHNAAREPEIADLQGFLRAMGASVSGGGTATVVIRGKELHPGDYTVMADRIVAATYLCGVAACGGEGEFLGTDGGDLIPVLTALEAAGCRVGRRTDAVWVQRKGPLRGIGTITTGPYPAFPTDAQPLLGAVLAGAAGESAIVETIFDRRFRYVDGLRSMGAEIQVEGTRALIRGRPLHGARVAAPDLRGGAALTIAGLAAAGETTLTALGHMDRGYQRLEEAFSALGGQIQRDTRHEGSP